jgi:hypothetical protein
LAQKKSVPTMFRSLGRLGHRQRRVVLSQAVSKPTSSSRIHLSAIQHAAMQERFFSRRSDFSSAPPGYSSGIDQRTSSPRSIFRAQLLRPYDNFLSPFSTDRIRLGLRYMSSKNGDESKSGIKSTKEGAEIHTETEVPHQTSTEGKPKPSVEGQDEGGRIQHIVESVETNFRRVSNEWNTGDLISVYSIVALIGIIVVAPIFVR